MKYDAKEIKTLTGKRTRAEGETALYQSLEQRQWRYGDRAYGLAGYDRRRDIVHFTSTWAAPGGGAGHSRLGLPLRAAIESDGNLAGASVLH